MERIEIEDLLKYTYPEHPLYSPKGDMLAYQAAHAVEKKNSYHRDIHLIKQGQDIQLTSTLNASIACWADDTHLICVRSTEETEAGTTDLYIIDVNGGEAMKWITLPFGMHEIKQINEKQYIASGTIDSNDANAYLDDADTKKKKAEEKKKNADYQIVDELPYWANGAGFTNKQRTALFLIDTEPLHVTRITEPSFDTNEFVIDHDQIYYTGQSFTRRMLLYTKLYRYDLTKKKRFIEYGKADLSIGNLFIMRDHLYCQITNMKEFGENETGRLSLYENGTFKEIQKPAYSLYDSGCGDTLLGAGKQSFVNGDAWYSLTTVEDHTEIAFFKKDMKANPVYAAKGIISCMASNGKKIAFIMEDWNHLGEVYEMNLNGTDVVKLTSLNDTVLKGKYIAKPKKLNYVSVNERLHGWVLLPEGFNAKKKYPAVLDIHGGPRAVYTEVFFHEMQVWAAKGYVVMFTNIKGSDGRGDEFADIIGQYGGIDYENLMDFVDAVLEKYPNIDQKKLCETGGSYGGFMTNWIITHTNRFCCTASQRSISNWVSMSLISDIGPIFGPDQCGADGLFGEKNTKILWEHSPLAYAEHVKTPTLFIHSDEDYRCPLPEGMQMMQALASRNIETKMVIFHGENHELSRSGKPLHRIKRLTEITNWFDAHTTKGKK